MTFSFFMLFRSVLQIFLTQICQTAPLTFRLPGVAAVPAMEYNAVMRFSQPVRRKLLHKRHLRMLRIFFMSPDRCMVDLRFIWALKETNLRRGRKFSDEALLLGHPPPVLEG